MDWTTSDGAFAVTHNPAALGFLPSWSLGYVHVDGGSEASFVERGDALCFGTPLFFGLATGACLESIRPEGVMDEENRVAGSLAFAYAPNRKFGLGFTLRYVGSRESQLDSLFTFDLSLALRLSPIFSVGIIASDLNGALDATGVDTDIPATFALVSALRPFGSDALTLELAGILDSNAEAGGRAALTVHVPRLGRVRVSGELYEAPGDDLEYRVTSGLAIDWGRASAEGGILVGDGFSDQLGWHLGVSYSGASRTDALPAPAYYRDLEVRGDIGARRLLSVVTELERIRYDARARGVFLRFRDSDFGLAYAQEMRLAIQQLEDAGKPVVCHLDAGSGSQLYACAVASRTYVDPAGTIQLMGPSTTVLLLGELLHEVGIRADFLRIGRYKSAVEQFENREMSEPAREARSAVLDDAYHRLVHDLAADLSRSPEETRRLIDEGPYVAERAVEHNLATAMTDEYAMNDELVDAFGGHYRRRRDAPSQAPRHWSVPRRIGVIVVDGNIVDGDNQDVPLIGIHTSGSRTIARAIDSLAADSSIAAIVLRVDSPGGSALASDVIWRAVMRARERKPVVASMGAVAASGGYYIASAAQEIWADPSTITGSIGILFGKVDIEPLADRIGVHIEQLRRGEHAGADTIYRPFTGDERAHLAGMLRHWYRLFLRRVAEGRSMTMTEVDALARGRIWSGDQAQRHGLVDRLGGFMSAVARARELAEIPPNSEITIVPSRPSTILDYVLQNLRDPDAESADEAPGGTVLMPASLRPAVNIVHTVTNTRSGVGLALMPFWLSPTE